MAFTLYRSQVHYFGVI